MQGKMSVSEIEELGYYDFMAYLNVPFFNIGGNESLDVLAERCYLGPDTHLLDVGWAPEEIRLISLQNMGVRSLGSIYPR